MPNMLIGIDDTDYGDSPGTGQLARRISAEITRLGGNPLGITRHQFLVDPLIPYTGHNRGICIATAWDGPIAGLEVVFELVRQWSAEGSDPGVCIAAENAVSPELIAWGEAAMRRVLTMREALSLAQGLALDLRPLGGTGQGIIGALASVGLRAGGIHGRFVDLPGLRELGEQVTADRLAEMGIEIERLEPVTAVPGRMPEAHAVYKTLGWVRPKLCNGKPVLSVEWSDDHDAWIPVGRKKIHPMEPGGQ
jgi:hypothetical protein